MEKQTSFDKQLDSLTDLLSEMETRGPFNPKVQSIKIQIKKKPTKEQMRGKMTAGIDSQEPHCRKRE